jgi:putative ATP-binding cassette transporter
MNLFRLLLRTSRRTAVLATLAGVVSGVSSAGLLALIHLTLNRPGTHPGVLAAAFGGLCLVVLLSKMLSQSLLVRISQRSATELCRRLSQRILAASLRHVEQTGAGRLLATLTGDVLTVVQAFNAIPGLCVNLVMLVCCLGFLAWLSPAVFALVVVLLLIGGGVYRLILNRAFHSLRQVREEQDRLVGLFRGLVEGIKELKIHRPRREAYLAQSLQPTLDAVEALGTVGMSRFMAGVSWGRTLFLLLIGVLLFAVPAVADVPRATLSGYTLAVLFALSPLEAVMAALPLLSRARVALAKVERLGLSLEESGSTETEGGDVLPAATWKRLELDSVCHAYHNEREGRGFLLGPIDLTLRPGELLFVAGGNGSGKTTLVKLLVGLYVPEAGEVRLDGRAVTAENREAYRQLFSVVFADYWLFDNLLGLGRADLDDRAAEYLDRLCLGHKVEVKCGVLSGTELSSGQRKRLALLTAYLEDRPVYVFDEWAADQDPQFKEVFYRQLLPELKARGKAVVVVSHDDRYFDVADRVVRLADGKVVDEPRENGLSRNGSLVGLSPA